jgi:hypothetical protein
LGLKLHVSLLELTCKHKSVGLVSQAEIYLKKQHFNLEHLYKIAYILECNLEVLIQQDFYDSAGE